MTFLNIEEMELMEARINWEDNNFPVDADNVLHVFDELEDVYYHLEEYKVKIVDRIPDSRLEDIRDELMDRDYFCYDNWETFKNIKSTLEELNEVLEDTREYWRKSLIASDERIAELASDAG